MYSFTKLLSICDCNCSDIRSSSQFHLDLGLRSVSSTDSSKALSSSSYISSLSFHCCMFILIDLINCCSFENRCSRCSQWRSGSGISHCRFRMYPPGYAEANRLLKEEWSFRNILSRHRWPLHDGIAQGENCCCSYLQDNWWGGRWWWLTVMMLLIRRLHENKSKSMWRSLEDP